MTTVDEDEPFNELVDLKTQAMHGVGKAANGTSFLIAKSAADGPSGGLLAPEQVRELLGGPDAPEAERPHAGDTITMSGSPGAIVRLMKEAASRRAVAVLDLDPELDQVVKSSDGGYVAFLKAKYSAEDKRKLAAQGHAMRNADGEPDYPIDDEEDLGKAILAVGRGGADHDRIRKYVIGRARAMGKSDQIPDNWASDGSLKQPVAKADGDGSDPGSPAWEATDAANGDAVVAKILACVPDVKALAMREATEVGAGHTDDICDVLELQGAIDALTCAAKTVAGFVVSERAEAGAVAKAQQQPASTTAATAATSPKENTVDTTTTEVTAAAGTEPTAVSKAAALAAQLGITPEKLQEIGAQAVLKAAQEAAATQTTDANPAPAETARVIPGTDTVQSPAQPQDTGEVMKAMASSFATALSEAVAPLAKQVGDLAGQVSAQGERVEKMAQQPDDRRSPLLNGATGEPGLALRDVMAKSPEWQTIAKAVNELPDGPAKDEARRKLALQALEARFS